MSLSGGWSSGAWGEAGWGMSVYFSDISEDSQAQDVALTTNVVFSTACTDGITAADTIRGRFLWEPVDTDQTASWTPVTATQAAAWADVGTVQDAAWTPTQT